MTTSGELMGMFLTREIPRGLSAEETILLIKSQGGLVNIPHPFGRWPMYDAKKLLSPEIISQVDLIEAFNSRAPFSFSPSKARKLARKYSLPLSAGSDAHTPGEIGKSYVEMPEFSSAHDFLLSLSQGRIVGHKSSPFIHFASTWAKLGKQRC